MKKIFYCFLLFVLLLLFFNGEEIDIKDVEFKGLNVKESTYEFDKNELKGNYNIVYSPFLPAGGIYSIKDVKTGKEAIVQVGFAEVDKSPYIIYMPEYLFNFFASSHENDVKSLQLKIKFLAWNREGEEANNLNIYSLVVKPEDAIEEITENGKNVYYLQIGAFSFYQNSYPLIIKLLPSLKVVPRFYMVKKDKDNEMFRVLAGPYTIEKAREISKDINTAKKSKIYIKSGEKVLTDFKSDDGE